MASRRPAAPPPPQSANLTVEQMRRGVDRLNKRIADLEAFDPATVNERWSAEVGVLGKAIEETLSAVFGHGTVEYNRYLLAQDLDDGPVMMGGGPDSPYEVRKYLTDGKQKSLLQLRQAVRGLEEEIADRVQHVSSAQSRETAPQRDLSKVFVVHGHDGEARQTIARFIEKLGFEAIILHERPNKGRTIITKFREEAAGVGFAVVLMTPDDVGGKALSHAAGPVQARARQNVVFELGFFIGALGPERVAALVKGEIERPSDFDGVVYLSLDSGHWQMELGRELKEAGYTHRLE
jgi:predicted nucleotide-binding protein